MSTLKVNQIQTINNQPLKIVGNLIVDSITSLSGSSGTDSATTISDFWVNNLNSTGNTLTVKNNLTVDGSVLGSYFYGDGSNLTNLPGKQISSSIGQDSFVQNGPIDTLSFGDNIASLGVGGSANGDVSIALGGGNSTGTKEKDMTYVLNGKYIVIFGDVKNDFVAGNLKPKPITDIKFTGLSQSTGITVTYKVQSITGNSNNGCIYYAITNNTASIITFTYTNCQTGLSTQLSVLPYSMVELCSSSQPTYTYYSWMAAYVFPVVITQIGTCCDTLEIVSATTLTVISATTTTSVQVPFVNNCKTYKITNNIYPYTLDIQYTSCTNTLTSLFLSDYEDTVCAIAPPTGWFGSSLGTAMTVTQISSQCCGTYNVYNPAWCPITVYYTDCFNGLTASTTITGYLSARICSLTEPTFDTSCWSLSGYNPTIYSPRVTFLTGTSLCQQFNYVTNTVITTAYTVTTIVTGCTGNNTYLTGLTGCVNYIIQNNAPTSALIYYTDCLGHYQSTTLNTGNTTNFCSSNYPVLGISSAYTGNIVITPSGNCETLCITYRFTKTTNTNIPAIWDVKYLDCDFNEQTIQLRNAGDYVEVCAILGSVQRGTNISMSQLGSCAQQNNRNRNYVSTQRISGGTVTISGLTLSNGSIFNNSTVHPINIVHVTTGTTTGGTIFISGGTSYSAITGTTTTVTTGTTSVTATTITTGITSIVSGATGCTVYTQTLETTYQTILNTYVTGNTVITGYTIVSASTIVTGFTIVNCNLVNTISGTSVSSGTTIVSGTTQITGTSVTVIYNGLYLYVTGATTYTVIELSEELPLEFNTGTIVSNYFGLGAVAMGLQTQSVGMASVSQNMFTTATGDGSHAEGCTTYANGDCSHSEGENTVANGKASHSGGIGSLTRHTGEMARSSGTFVKQGDAQYSFISMMGTSTGTTKSYMYVDGISENIKILKKSIVSITFQVNALTYLSAGGKGGFTGDGAMFYVNNIFVRNDNTGLFIVNGTSIYPSSYIEGFFSTMYITLEAGDSFSDYNELKFAIYGKSGQEIQWSGLITIVQSYLGD